MMRRIAGFLTGRSPILMVAAVATGLTLPDLAALLRPWVVPVSVIMVPLSILRVDMVRLATTLSRPGLVALAAFAVLVALPLVAGAVALAIGLPGWLATGLVLIAAAPPLSSAAAFAILLRIDATLVTAVSLVATLAVPATLWVVTSALPGLGAGVDVTALVLRLAGFIGFAFALALAVRRLFGEARIARAAPAIDAATVLLVLVIGVGVMHEIGQAMRATPVLWAGLFLATWLVSVASCALAVAVFWRAGRDLALASGVAAAVKNIALMVAAVAPVVEPRVLLVVMTAQLPIFLAPLILRPVFGRLARVTVPPIGP